MRLRWTPAASRDLTHIEEYIARDNPRAATDSVVKIVRLVSFLADHPGIGRPGRVDGTRELVISGLPYIAAYAERGEFVTILRVLHTAMKWPSRL